MKCDEDPSIGLISVLLHCSGTCGLGGVVIGGGIDDEGNDASIELNDG